MTRLVSAEANASLNHSTNCCSSSIGLNVDTPFGAMITRECRIVAP